MFRGQQPNREKPLEILESGKNRFLPRNCREIARRLPKQLINLIGQFTVKLKRWKLNKKKSRPKLRCRRRSDV